MDNKKERVKLMVTVDPKKTVRVHVDPIDQNQSTNELAQYMRDTLKKRSQVQDVDLS